MLSALLGAGAFLTITLVPFTKYPANPPGVGDPDTIDTRTVLFVAMIVISLLAAVAAWRIRRQLLDRLGSWNASIVAIAVFVAVIAVAQLILPAVHETPAGFPADVLYRFRLASLCINLTTWTAIGLGFGAAAERLLRAEGHHACCLALRVRRPAVGLDVVPAGGVADHLAEVATLVVAVVEVRVRAHVSTARVRSVPIARRPRLVP